MLTVVEDPVQDGAGNHRISEDLSPICIGLVRRQDHRSLLISQGDQLKEEIGSQPIDWDVSDFIDDQKFELGELLKLLLQ